MGIRILGTGSYLPSKVMKNKDLETLVKDYAPDPKRTETFDDWVYRVTGIRERRLAGEEETVAYMGGMAAKRALEMAGVKGDEVGLILEASSRLKETVVPTTDQQVGRQIGATRAAGYYLNAACAGFVHALASAAGLLQTCELDGKYALIIGSERLFPHLNHDKWKSSVLFGDGAGAMLVVRDDQAPFSAYLGGDCSGDKALRVVYDQDMPITMEDGSGETGRKIFRDAVRAFTDTAQRVLFDKEDTSRPRINPGDLCAVLAHQANRRILEEHALQMVKVFPGFNEKMVYNIECVANTSSASIPVLLDEEVRSGRLGLKDHVLIEALGIGYHWGAVLL